MDEHRHNPRQRTYKGGAVYVRNSRYDCLIRNLSATGACLEIANPASLPDDFTLIIKPEDRRRSCHVAWRDAERVGVRFV